MRILLVVALAATVLLGCKKDKANFLVCDTCEDCGTVDHKFQDHILPIFTGNCAFSGCHDDATASAGYAWTSYENIAQVDRLQNILSAIRWESGTTNMPFGFPNPLPDSTIHKIECWVNAGFPND